MRRFDHPSLAASCPLRLLPTLIFRCASPPTPSLPQEEEDAAEFAAGLAGDLFLYQPEHVLAGQYLFDEWDPELVRRRGIGWMPSDDASPARHTPPLLLRETVCPRCALTCRLSSTTTTLPTTPPGLRAAARHDARRGPAGPVHQGI